MNAVKSLVFDFLRIGNQRESKTPETQISVNEKSPKSKILAIQMFFELQNPQKRKILEIEIRRSQKSGIEHLRNQKISKKFGKSKNFR